jgi:hypothetical protein
MTPRTIEEILAIYAAGVSTLSFFLAVKAHNLAEKAHSAAGPIVYIDWEYDETTRELIVSVVNSGRSDTTIYDLHLVVICEIITSVSITGRSFAMHMVPVADVPKIQWWKDYDPTDLPVRIAASSKFLVHVNSDGISFPLEKYSLHDILLRFVVETPNSYEMAYFRGDVLRHFIGLEPDVPVRDREPSIRERHPHSWPALLGHLPRPVRWKRNEADPESGN